MDTPKKGAERISYELEYALTELKRELAGAHNKEKIILSDFDQTLCNEYVFDEVVNGHIGRVHPNVIAATQPHHLIVASGRTGYSPTLHGLWECGFTPNERPIIAENGGTMIIQTPDGIEHIDLVDPETTGIIQHIAQEATEHLSLSNDNQLDFYKGRTFFQVSIGEEVGEYLPEYHAYVADTLHGMLPDGSPLKIVGEKRGIISVMHQEVSKGTAFQTYLEMMGIPREDVYVIGMGDDINDTGIFDVADLSLGFSERVSGLVHIAIPHGPQAVPYIMDAI